MDKNKVQTCTLFYSPPLKPKNYIMSIKRQFEDNSDVEEFLRIRGFTRKNKKYYEDHPQEL